MTTLPHKGHSKHIRRWNKRLAARIEAWEADRKNAPQEMRKPGSGKR